MTNVVQAAPDEALEIARRSVDAAVDRQADDIVLLDLRPVVDFVDYFVVCSGETARQVKAIADAIDESQYKVGVRARVREGDADSGWILIDYGDVIVHIFGPEEREYYRLERLWKDAVPVVQIQ